jgi:hypothetical protein
MCQTWLGLAHQTQSGLAELGNLAPLMDSKLSSLPGLQADLLL